jgi:hypothetical protein
VSPWELGLTALLVGILLGRWWAGWMIWHYVYSKRPDAAGFRTGIHLKDGIYYIVTGEEYLKVME